MAELRDPAAARPTSRRRLLLRAGAGGALLTALLAGAYGSFVEHLHAIDHDALAAVGHIRETGRWVGWTNGFYLNGLLTGAASALLDATGRVRDNYLLAYSLVVTASLTGTVLLAYAILLALTRSVVTALAFATVLALSPGLLYLLAVREDNLIASFFHMQYVALYLACALRTPAGRPRAARLLEAALPVSLALAVMAHHQLNVLWATPALLPWLRGESCRGAPLRRTLLTYAAAGALCLLAYVPLTLTWHGSLEPGLYLRTVGDWIVPNSFYRSYYFWERLGWDLPAQAHAIGRGVSQLAFGNAPPSATAALGVAALLGLAAWAGLRQRAWRDPAARVLALFVVIHVPHSLVYESGNVERWDALLPPLVVLMGLLIHRAHIAPLAVGRRLALGRLRLAAPGGLRVPVLAAALPALAAVLLFDLGFHGDAVAWQRKTRAERQDVLALLESRVEPGAAASGRRVLVLSRERFDRFFMLAETYYAYGRDLYAVDAAGGIWRSRAVYPNPVPVDRAEFAELTRGAVLVTDAEAAARLGIDGELARRVRAADPQRR